MDKIALGFHTEGKYAIGLVWDVPLNANFKIDLFRMYGTFRYRIDIEQDQRSLIRHRAAFKGPPFEYCTILIEVTDKTTKKVCKKEVTFIP